MDIVSSCIGTVPKQSNLLQQDEEIDSNLRILDISDNQILGVTLNQIRDLIEEKGGNITFDILY